MELLQFWGRIEPLIFDPVQKLFKRVIPEFQSRWESVLGIAGKERRAEYRSGQLKPLVESLFAVPDAGWQLARYHSPDVMIAAASVEAIRRGDYMFVLGEVHMAANTLGLPLLFPSTRSQKSCSTFFKPTSPSPRRACPTPALAQESPIALPWS